MKIMMDQPLCMKNNIVDEAVYIFIAVRRVLILFVFVTVRGVGSGGGAGGGHRPPPPPPPIKYGQGAKKGHIFSIHAFVKKQ